MYRGFIYRKMGNINSGIRYVKSGEKGKINRTRETPILRQGYTILLGTGKAT
jgi:hypothetical protein